MLKTFCCFLLFVEFTIITCQNDKPIVEISDGKLQGIINQTVGENKTYYAFRGIPYAKPPIDLLRFTNPVKNDKWNGTLNATADSSVCLQPKGSIGTAEQFEITGSEDCLYINVYTTNLSNQSNLPVVVWIYGGSFTEGSSMYSLYTPDYILEKDVVYVAFNYRVGVLGFLSTEDMSSPGNWGLKDQVLALKWVQENIIQFGGDPTKVTIFGESAGGASVAYLLQAPDKTKGLFRGAIMDSGNSLCQWSLTREPRKIADAIALKLGIIELSTTKLVEKLRKVDADKLALAQVEVYDLAVAAKTDFSGLPIGPVKEPDHADAIFSSSSYQQLLNGDIVQVPILTGFNSLEAAIVDNRGSLLVALLLIGRNLSPTGVAPYDMTDNLIKRTIASIKIKNKYFGLKPMGLDGGDLAKYLTVDLYVRPTRKLVQLASNYTDVYLYQFSYKGNLSNPNTDSNGAGHGEELSYIFGSYRTATPDDALVRERMVTMWTNFVKELNPTPTATDVLQNITWIPNTSTTVTDKHVQCLNITTSLEIVENPFQDDWKFYEDLYDKYGDPSYYSTY